MNKQRIHISIGFGDVILPVIECGDGHQRVPLKPIALEAGVNWQGQSRKIIPEKYIYRRLGAEFIRVNSTETWLNTPSDAEFRGVNAIESASKNSIKPQLCIRMDRVEAFLNSLNPENIRGKGNHDAADWLEAKHSEWDDALHAYETNGFAAKSSSGEMREAMYKLDRIKNPQIKICVAQSINDEFGTDLPIAKQQGLDI